MDLIPGQSRIAIVGAGAVGCYYGAKLALAGHDVHFLMRSDLTAVRERGLIIRSEGAEARIPTPQVYGSTAEIGPCDLVIIAIKTIANAALNHLLPPLLKPETQLLTLQNGLGNEEFLGGAFGAKRVLGGLCFVCLNRVDCGVIEHYGHGLISIGEYQRPAGARTHALVQAFRQAGVDAQVVDDLANERWRKLVWNIPFNGLSIAAGKVTTAEILADEGLRQLAKELMHETIEAARCLGHTIPLEYAQYQLDRTSPMGPYRPSSLIDFERGAPVEVEAIWGEPFRQARAAGCPMARLEMLYNLLRWITR